MGTCPDPSSSTAKGLVSRLVLTLVRQLCLHGMHFHLHDAVPVDIPVLFSFTASSCSNSIMMLYYLTILSLALVARDAATQYMCLLLSVEDHCIVEMHSYSTHISLLTHHYICICSCYVVYHWMYPPLLHFCLTLSLSGFPK